MRLHQLAIERGDPDIVDLAPAVTGDVGLKPGSEDPRDDCLRLLPYAMADDFRRNEQVLPVGPPAPHEDVRVRVVRVPVIDRDPLQLCPHLPLKIRHHLPDHRTQVAQRLAILGADDQAEVPAVVRPAGRDRVAVEVLGAPIIEAQPRVGCFLALQVVDGALQSWLAPRLPLLAREIADMRPQRGALAATVDDEARFHHDPAR